MNIKKAKAEILRSRRNKRIDKILREWRQRARGKATKPLLARYKPLDFGLGKGGYR
jgi:hypothetical protein